MNFYQNQRDIMDDMVEDAYAEKNLQDKRQAESEGQDISEYDWPTPGDGEDYQENHESEVL